MKRLTDKQVLHQAMGRRMVREMAARASYIICIDHTSIPLGQLKGHIFHTLPIGSANNTTEFSPDYTII